MKRKMKILLSTMAISSLPLLSISCSSHQKTAQVLKLNNTIREKKMKQNETFQEINAICSRISSKMKQGIDGSDFTPSQSMADKTVKKKIIKKIEQLCIWPTHVRFAPKLKSTNFKAGDNNYIDVEIICVKDGMQTILLHQNLQIKNVRQNLKELLEQAEQDLKEHIDCKKSYLIEDDDLNFKFIENEMLNLIRGQLKIDDERLTIKLTNLAEEVKNNSLITVKVIAKDDDFEETRTVKVKLVNLCTLNTYVSWLVKELIIVREDGLFANSPFPYLIKDVEEKIKKIFINLNVHWLGRREIASFDLYGNWQGDSQIKFDKEFTALKVKISLKFNKALKNISLNLIDIENHPEYILNSVFNYFETNDIDLANTPIFQDADFYSYDTKKVYRKLWSSRKVD